MNRQNTNPFEDGPFSSIGRNPFDSSSEDSNRSDEDDDDLSYDDEASSVYEDCNTETVEPEIDDEHLKNESQLPDDLQSIFSDVTLPTQLEAGSQIRDEYSNTANSQSLATSLSGSRKRVAPLSFEVRTVHAKPALDFNSVNNSVQGSDFVSPLETALINRVDHLQGENHDDDDSQKSSEDDECDDDNEQVQQDLMAAASNDSAFGSVTAYLSSFMGYFGSSTRFNLDKDTNVHEESKESASGSTEKKQLLVKPMTSEACLDKSTHSGIDISPLAEAKDVLQRMDHIEETLQKKKKKKQSTRNGSHLKRKRSTTSIDDTKNVLKKIECHAKGSEYTMDNRHSSSPWNRLIILEELGTASSWIILLAPYLAFFIAISMDSHATLWEQKTNTEYTHALCNPQGGEQSFPIVPVEGPCSYEYRFKDTESYKSLFGQNIDPLQEAFLHGIGFTSGVIQVPALSTFLYGDLDYSSISENSLSMISNGEVYYSTVVMQQKLHDDAIRDSDWFPVYLSEPEPLMIECEDEEMNDNSTLSERLHCKSPRSLKLYFAMPDTSILTGGNIRVDTLIKHIKNVTDISLFVNEDLDKSSMLEIARSVSYHFTTPSEFSTKFLVAVRIFTMLITALFMCFWFWCMGMNGFFFLGSCSFCSSWGKKVKSMEEKKKREVLWFECPWILFPERRYLLLMMVSIMLLQNPVLVLMSLNPALFSSIKMRVLADCMVGIGLHSIFALWLCVMEGLRYHTAKAARKRAEHQKEIIELQRASTYLASSGLSDYNPDSPSNHLVSYFDEFGDMYGSGSSAWMNLRLDHDLCGVNWFDFIVTKLLLLSLGTVTTIGSSIYRFSFSGIDENDPTLELLKSFNIDPLFLREHHHLYLITTALQLTIFALWAVLIVRAALKTGSVLRKQPFLSTRPAQLAFRILMSILILGVASFVLPLTHEIITVIRERTSVKYISYGSSIREDYVQNNFLSLRDALVHVVSMFPYTGSASSLGACEIIYITVATLSVAFVFLPSTSYILDEDYHPIVMNELGLPEENQRRDKRDVLTMSKYTHTWRVFPMPVERHKQKKSQKVKTVKCYQLDENLKHMKNDIGRGTIYKENYTPLFSVETALWLCECAWQTYYSSSEYKTDDFAPGIMNLDSVGLELEADIFNEQSDIRAFVGTNLNGQVDGESDSIVVISFRGTCSSKNLKTDFNWGQETLPYTFISGADKQPQFKLNISKVSDTEAGLRGKCSVIQNGEAIKEADHILRNTILTQQAFPCVHSGFIEVYNLVRDEIMDTVIKVFKRQIEKALQRCLENESNEGENPFILPKIYVTGHSLGGALAQLLSLDISCNIELNISNISSHVDKLEKPSMHTRGKSDGMGLLLKNNPILSDLPPFHGETMPLLHKRRHSFASQPSNTTAEENQNSIEFVHGMLSGGMKFGGIQDFSKKLRPPIACYTFGQPRVGNRSFSRFFKSQVCHSFRVVSEGDAITSLPLPTSCPPALYKHSGLEVILDEGSNGNINVGPTVVETLFRFSKVRTNIFAHLMEKYRDGLESALTHDELQEVYKTHGVNSRSLRHSYNTSDMLPDWVTHISRRNF